MSIDPRQINTPGYNSAVYIVLRTNADAKPLLDKLDQLRNPLIWLATPCPSLNDAYPGIEILSRDSTRIQRVGEALDAALETQQETNATEKLL